MPTNRAKRCDLDALKGEGARNDEIEETREKLNSPMILYLPTM